MADNDRIHPHDEEKRNTIHWVDDGEGGMVYVDEYEEYLRQIEEQLLMGGCSIDKYGDPL